MKILVVSDQEHEKQVFVLDSIRSLEKKNIRVASGFRKKINQTTDYEVVFQGVEPDDQPAYWRLVAGAAYVHALRIIRPDLRAFIDATANFPKRGRLFGSASALRALSLLRSIKQFGPDLIHINFAWNIAFILPVAQFLNVPIVCTVHGSDILKREEWKEVLVHPLVRRIICVSNGLKNGIDEYDAAMKKKTVVIYNSINELFLAPVSPPPSEFRIICIAALRKLKNHRWLLNALQHLKQRGERFKCVLIGEAPFFEPFMLDEVRSMIDARGLQDDVRLLGRLSPEETKEELDRSTVLALTSESEGLPMSVVETLARQCVPVTTMLPGTREVLRDDRFGLLVPLNNVDALADALIAAHYRTLEQGEKLGEGRQFVIDNFHPHVHAQRLIDIYEQVVR